MDESLSLVLTFERMDDMTKRLERRILIQALDELVGVCVDLRRRKDFP